MRRLSSILLCCSLAFVIVACKREEEVVIHRTESEFTQFEAEVGMNSEEALELVREFWGTQEGRIPRLTVDRLIVGRRFFFSIERQKTAEIELTGYYVDPVERKVTFERHRNRVERRRGRHQEQRE